MDSKNTITDSAPVCSLSDKQLLQDLLNSDIMKSDVVKQQLNIRTIAKQESLGQVLQGA